MWPMATKKPLTVLLPDPIGLQVVQLDLGNQVLWSRLDILDHGVREPFDLGVGARAVSMNFSRAAKNSSRAMDQRDLKRPKTGEEVWLPPCRIAAAGPP